MVQKHRIGSIVVKDFCRVIYSSSLFMATFAPYYPPPVLPWQQIFWLILNLFIYFAWWTFFTRRYSREFSPSERTLAAFVLMIAQIEVCFFILGSLRLIGWRESVFFNAISSFIVLLSGVSAPTSVSLIAEFVKPILTLWNISRRSPVVVAFLILALFGFGWYMYLGQLLPPMAADSWGYHLTWAAFAHQERHLGPFAYNNPYINYFPKNTDILFLWTITGAGTERFASIVQGLFGLASVNALYILGRRIGGSNRDALIGSLLVLSIPCVLHMQWKAMVDLSVMGACLTSLAFLGRKRLTVMSCILAAIMAGFALGSKGSALYTFMALVLFFLYRLVPMGFHGLSYIMRGRLARGIGSILVFSLVAFAFGSYFYLRNWYLEGNPTGIYEVKVAGKVFFEGTQEVNAHFNRALLSPKIYDALERGPEWPIVLDGFFDPQIFFSQGNRIGGWGPVWTILMLPAIPLALIWALIRRRWKVLALIISCILPFVLFPYNHTWARYHLFLIGAGVLSFIYIISLLKRTRIYQPLIYLAAFMMFLSIYISGPQNIVLPEEIQSARRVPYEQSDRFILFNSWNSPGFTSAVKTVTAPGKSLALTHRVPQNKSLAFWNSWYTNRMEWIDWRRPPDEWYGDLVSRGIDYVYTGPGTMAENYVLSQPRKFRGVFSDDALGSFAEVLKPDEPMEATR